MGRNADDAVDEQRWADAEALLSDSPDAAVVQRVRSRRRRIWLIVFAVTLTLMVLAGVAGLLIAGAEEGDAVSRSPSHPAWVSVLGFSLSLLGAAVIGTGVVRMRREGQFGGPLSALTRSQNRSLRRQVLGKETMQPARLALLRDMAGRMTRMNPLFVLWAGLLIQQIGGFVSSPGLWRAAFIVFFALATVGAVVQARRDAGRAQQFLDRDAPGHGPTLSS